MLEIVISIASIFSMRITYRYGVKDWSELIFYFYYTGLPGHCFDGKIRETENQFVWPNHRKENCYWASNINYTLSDHSYTQVRTLVIHALITKINILYSLKFSRIKYFAVW